MPFECVAQHHLCYFRQLSFIKNKNMNSPTTTVQIPGLAIDITLNVSVPQQPYTTGISAGYDITRSGWLHPTLDKRDYTIDHPEIISITRKLNLPDYTQLPERVDLSGWCSPVGDQHTLLSCTAFAGTGIVEYFENRAFSKFIKASPLFLYKCTRNLMQVTGDSGAYLRDVMKALALFGVPGEQYCPYITANYDNEPTAFLYAMAANYRVLKYFCHDPLFENKPGADVLNSVKQFIAAGIPSMFGLSLPLLNVSSNVTGGLPFSATNDSGGNHALVAVGYDDTIEISSKSDGVINTQGALLIRNCKGINTWGDKGYGWLPYEYVNSKRALDFWSMLSMDWVDTGKFGLGESNAPANI